MAIKYTNAAGMFENGIQVYNEDTGVISARTLTAGSGNVTVTNGIGTGGNPTVDVNTATDSTIGLASFDAYDFVVTAGNVTLRPASSVYFVGKWGNDAADGLTIESAKLTIQAAVTAAPASSTILVYPGTYTETVTHAANNVTMIAQGKPNNVILTQADANVVNFSTYSGLQYKGFTIQVTAATTAINTVQGTTGLCAFKECHLKMTCAAAIAAVAQPAIGAITGAGTLKVILGQATYAHTGAGGATANKGAFKVGDGGTVNLSLIKGFVIANSGTALVSSTGIDTSSTGVFEMNENEICITDPNATIVAGLVYLGGTGTDHEFRRNTIHVTATANTGYGVFTADTASTTRTFYNHIHVVDTGGSSYGFLVDGAATLTSQFDDIIADDGNSIAGTFVQVNSEEDGYFTATNTVYATTFDTNVAAAGVTLTGTTLLADGTDAHIPVTITPKGSEAVTIDGLDYPMADGTAGQVVTTNGSAVLSFSNAIAGGGLDWEVVTDATKTAECNHGYITNNAGTRVVVTIPTTAAVGCIVRVAGLGAAGWGIAQGASELIHIGSSVTTTGVAGKLESTNQYDVVELVCIVADTEWTTLSVIGNITVT